MRARTMTCLLSALVAYHDVSAQPLDQVQPGTLVRIALRSGGRRLIGPLAEVRADTVHLSSTLASPSAAIPLANVARFAYADSASGTHAGRGALIGGAIGVGLGLLATRGARAGNDDSMFIDGRTIFTFLAAAGTIAGIFLGGAEPAIRWVTPAGQPRTGHASRPTGQVVALRLALRF